MNDKIRKPNQCLLIAPDETMRNQILSGQKQITIREGIRRYESGRPVWLVCHIVPFCVKANVTEVKHCPLKNLTNEDLYADGYATVEDAVVDLKKYYPDITEDSFVTSIRWDSVEHSYNNSYNKEEK